MTELLRQIAWKRLVSRPLANASEFHSIGIARVNKGNATPAGEKYSEALRASSVVINPSSLKFKP